MSSPPRDVVRAARKAARVADVPTVDVRDFVLGYCEGYARACESGNVVRAPDRGTSFGRGFAAGWESVAKHFRRPT